MNKHWGLKIWAAALPLTIATTLAGEAQAQAPRTIYLYNAALGRAPASMNAAKTGSWGNGVVSNSRRVDYEGAPVLQLTTRNPQEGARFDLTTPVDLAPYMDGGFLRFRLRFNSGFGGFGGGGFGGGGFGGGPGGGFGGGGRGGQGGGGLVAVTSAAVAREVEASEVEASEVEDKAAVSVGVNRRAEAMAVSIS